MTPIPAETREIAPRIAIVEDRIKTLSGKIVDMEHDLFGNGQPGALSRLEAKMERIEEKVGKLMVGIAVLSGGSGALGLQVLKSLFGG